MKKNIYLSVMFLVAVLCPLIAAAQGNGGFFTKTALAQGAAPVVQTAPTVAPVEQAPLPCNTSATGSTQYSIGVDDILDVSILQPEKMEVTVTVSPDGAITFPYIGQVMVKDKSPEKVQAEIQAKLADGYLKYPVVSVSLKESHSRKFFVYGEVTKPGIYFLEDNTTVLKAISNAGGFTKFGSSSHVTILRPKTDNSGYETVKVNIKAIMAGKDKDVVLQVGDIVQVQEGVF